MSKLLSKKSVLSKLSFLFLISILVFSFTACSNEETPEQVTPDQNEAETPADAHITLATTTSVNDSGLMDELVPVFEADTDYILDVVSQGTGQAIQTGEDGNADILLIHSKPAEEEFVEAGFGLERVEIFYNHFVLVGPADDPANIAGLTAAEAFKNINDTKSTFVSRGDDSGTHKKELSIWENISIEPEGEWYLEAGKGMGDVLLMASEVQGYALTDKATFLSMKELDLEIIVNESEDLLNQYTVIQVNPDKHEDINKEGADAFLQWITSDKALDLITEYGKEEYGESLFTVNYKK